MTPAPLHRVVQLLLGAGFALLALATGFLLGQDRQDPQSHLQVHDLEDRHCMETLVRELEAWPKCRK